MLPAGHEPTIEDQRDFPSFPEIMHTQLALEASHLLRMTYTHYSHDEIICGDERFVRRFSRAAFDPFTIPNSMRSAMIDETGHVNLQIRGGFGWR